MLRSSLLFPSTHPPHALPQANFIHAMRLFRGVPVWTPFNRPQEEHASRKFYVDNYVSGRGGAGCSLSLRQARRCVAPAGV